ncbi:hypothetical protein F2Q68_00027931 [Brassica cretica]|uniref:Uncharacterized protein n=1 Tax=Brassica cretica TaxID=69181 RepID=A0A8S9ICJ0_BRACR|nr:hypothetical protein F2Q68_00027931 [Brassica cretica]
MAKKVDLLQLRSGGAWKRVRRLLFSHLLVFRFAIPWSLSLSLLCPPLCIWKVSKVAFAAGKIRSCQALARCLECRRVIVESFWRCSRFLGFGRRFLKPLVGLVARGGERVAHPSVLVAVIVWLRLALEDPIISEASSSPCCQRVSKFVVLARCLQLHSGVGDSRLWLLRGSVVTSLSTICYLPGFWIQSTVGVSSTCSYRIVLSVVATGEESGGPSGQRISLSLVAQSPSFHSRLPSVLGEGSLSITSLWAASGFVEDCTCGYGAIFKGGVLYPFFYTACALIESDDYRSETHRELVTLETT